MQALQDSLTLLLASLPPRPINKAPLDALVAQTLEESRLKTSPETWKTKWEYVLRKEVYDLAATEGKALKQLETKYYDELSDRLDLILTFTEHDACDQIFPFNTLQDLLETQTIASCSHVFSWIEQRADRLTAGMVPQKGKALVLLRTLNDLLRRLSKMGATTQFCGRILTFLSRVFPLGERSGVNLRGEYGPMWEGPGAKGHERKDEEANQMEVDEAKEEQAAKDAERKRKEKDDFFYTFWSLQLPFSRPHQFSETRTFSAFKTAVDKVLPVIKEATAKERALMGNKSLHATVGASSQLKRKRAPAAAAESPATSEYYFAKYLTSPELLDLEISDTHFRRQLLFQLLIVLNHLLNFTKAAKATWYTPRNRSLQLDFTLEPTDAQWVHDTIARAVEELRQTSPHGRAFAEAVQVMLEREKNWVRWKNELCPPFDREAWYAEVEIDGETKRVGLEEATEGVRKKMRMDPEEWPYRYGSAPLTEIWEMGYRDLRDLEHPFQAGDVKDFVKKVKQEDARIDMRRKQLTQKAERIAQARAKAATPQDGAPAPGPPAAASTVPSAPAAQPAPTAAPSVSSPDPAATHARNTLSAPAPLHPSLPAKPGTTPASGESAAPSPARVATPNPPPAATAVPTPAPIVALAPAPTPAPAPILEPAAIVLPPDDLIRKYEENKQRWAWLALRTARDQYLQYFGRIGAGDVVLLAQEIEKGRAEREKAVAEKEAAAAQASASPAPPVGMDEGAAKEGTKEVASAPAPDLEKGAGMTESPEKDTEGDVKMEDR
ncbi:THO complex subunit 1 [Trametes pubescens]|uniref:THO complex subunit 1 n=1 Tax=Trametes pubescens TaxID=154538 RepID=A0A1M2W2F4_TRAPU|nr:THO complex subunit 1 [Trametes pubescens]